jgi:O-antigen/teichoic acid export membrane protein
LSARTEGSLRSGVFWSLLAFLGAKSLTFVSLLALARLVAPEDFGLLASILAYIALLELGSDLGMKATVVYESEHGITPRVETAFTLNAIIASGLAAVGVLLAPLVAAFFHATDNTDLFRLATLDLVLSALGNVHDSLLLRGMEFRRRIVPQLAMNAVRAVATVTLAALGLAATGLVLGFLLGTLVWAVTLWRVTGFRPHGTIQRSAVRGMLAYGGWASVLEVLAAVGYRADVLVVGRALGPHSLGLYTVAQRVPELVIENVSWNLSIVGFPALARRRAYVGEGMVPTTLSLVRYGALYGLPVGAGIAVLAAPFVVVLFGERWAEAGTVMSALAIMYGLHAVVFPLGDVFKALGRQRVMAALNAVSIPVAVAAMVLAAPSGLVGVVWARVIVAVLQGLVLLALVIRVLDLRVATLAQALRPALVAAGGVVAGAGAVRLALPPRALEQLVLGVVAAAAGGGATLLFGARREFGELIDLVRGRGVPAATRGAT